MRMIRNTLYITTPDSYLSLDGENAVISQKGTETGRVPLHLIQGIIIFGYSGASPALMGKCAEYGIEISFLTMHGRFLGRFVGEPYGNVLLRKEQYRISDDIYRSLEISKSFIIGKIYNSRWVLERAKRDYSLRLDTDSLSRASGYLYSLLKQIPSCESDASLRGIEGEAANIYFGEFNQLILQQKQEFEFTIRNRRPPTDRINAMLSFMYTLLAHDAAAAVSAVGLDCYVGFFHTDRPGRKSLALDIMEEFRSVLADRFVLSLINKKQICGDDFEICENGAVLLKDKARKNILQLWQQKKQEVITHPFTGEKIAWGMAVHIQAQLLARYIRGDTDAYPPFMWK